VNGVRAAFGPEASLRAQLVVAHSWSSRTTCCRAQLVVAHNLLSRAAGHKKSVGGGRSALVTRRSANQLPDDRDSYSLREPQTEAFGQT
jgi:hypothetical protein